MATIIAHPQHGKMFVYSQADIDRHAALGWSVWVKPEPVPVVEPEPEQAAEPEQPRRRGRPRKA